MLSFIRNLFLVLPILAVVSGCSKNEDKVACVNTFNSNAELFLEGVYPLAQVLALEDGGYVIINRGQNNAIDVSWYNEDLQPIQQAVVDCFSLSGVKDLIEYVDNSIVFITDRGNCTNGAQELTLFRMNSTGEVLWEKEVLNIASISEEALVITKNDQILIYGTGYGDTRDLETQIYNKIGDTVTAKCYPRPGSQRSTEIIATNDGGYLLQAKEIHNTISDSLVILKVDANLNIEWEQILGKSNGTFESNHVDNFFDNSFLVSSAVGGVGILPEGFDDNKVFRINRDGDLLWQIDIKEIGTLRRILPHNNGFFMMLAENCDSRFTSTIISCDPEGREMWRRSYSKDVSIYPNSVFQVDGNKFILFSSNLLELTIGLRSNYFNFTIDHEGNIL